MATLKIIAKIFELTLISLFFNWFLAASIWSTFLKIKQDVEKHTRFTGTRTTFQKGQSQGIEQNCKLIFIIPNIFFFNLNPFVTKKIILKKSFQAKYFRSEKSMQAIPENSKVILKKVSIPIGREFTWRLQKIWCYVTLQIWTSLNMSIQTQYTMYSILSHNTFCTEVFILRLLLSRNLLIIIVSNKKYFFIYWIGCEQQWCQKTSKISTKIARKKGNQKKWKSKECFNCFGDIEWFHHKHCIDRQHYYRIG